MKALEEMLAIARARSLTDLEAVGERVRGLTLTPEEVELLRSAYSWRADELANRVGGTVVPWPTLLNRECPYCGKQVMLPVRKGVSDGE